MKFVNHPHRRFKNTLISSPVCSTAVCRSRQIWCWQFSNSYAMLTACISEARLTQFHTEKNKLLIQLFISILQRTAFSNPGRAIVKVMAMTTGELDYDELYHQQEGEDEIAFPPVSFLLWIIFLVLMPVLLSNLLVSC